MFINDSYHDIARFYNLNNEKEIEIQDKKGFGYKYTNFLKNGNFVTFESNIGSSNYPYPSVSIYALVKNRWIRKTFYRFNEKDISYGDFINDKMWMMAYDLIFLLDLATFKLQKFSLFVSVSFFIV